MAKISDINGVEPKIGDRVAVAEGMLNRTACLDICIVKDIQIKTEKTTKMTLTVVKSGKWLYNEPHDSNYDVGEEIIMRFPMEHCKFIVL